MSITTRWFTEQWILSVYHHHNKRIENCNSAVQCKFNEFVEHSTGTNGQEWLRLTAHDALRDSIACRGPFTRDRYHCWLPRTCGYSNLAGSYLALYSRKRNQASSRAKCIIFQTRYEHRARRFRMPDGDSSRHEFLFLRRLSYIYRMYTIIYTQFVSRTRSPRARARASTAVRWRKRKWKIICNLTHCRCVVMEK